MDEKYRSVETSDFKGQCSYLCEEKEGAFRTLSGAFFENLDIVIDMQPQSKIKIV